MLIGLSPLLPAKQDTHPRKLNKTAKRAFFARNLSSPSRSSFAPQHGLTCARRLGRSDRTTEAPSLLDGKWVMS